MKRLIAILILPACLYVQAQKKVTVYTTAAQSGLRLSQNEQLTFKEFKQPLETQPCVFIDPASTFQSFIGIGAAFTDAAAETFAKIPKREQQELLRAYFDKDKGIGYTLARTTIHSCDFSSGSYTYVNDNDTALKTFSVAHDEQYRIPFIKQAIAAAGGKLTLYVSPWSPPAWMKDNNSMLQGGKLKPGSRQQWANYYVKFIKTYEAKGIPIWGLSVQNEPMAKQRWESCIFTAEEERDFIKQYLGPTLHREGLGSKKLIAWDHNRDLLFQRASVILGDKEAAKYVWGVGFHWYETWTGGPMQFDNLRLVNQAFPGKNLIFTEGCKEKFDIDSVNNWALGEKYGYSMINDFNNGTVAWTDWNILLDEKGGPNHVGNFCFAPVHADTKTGKLIYTNAYYYIGHFSKFIRPGAKRIAASASRAQLQTTAFLNTDGSVVVVVMNTTDQKLSWHLWIEGQGAAAESLPHSISTFVIQ
ncbi:glycoside hydrolase family 30 protein [Pseudoflavitalea sp. X16]|uniref:glycoside hydrolase family 30 protein n=1 Tax=Paraflavitalea devenefica TaxID=2716334 RepID=UPI0014233140|nr:glycoside hydrolase family 30 protein [Paraflavitalea devenefica]NII23801.1 glycoside hydrolase family 30 protein [Paraflavitalea devenefica]